jgi:hypothetical protein
MDDATWLTPTGFMPMAACTGGSSRLLEASHGLHRRTGLRIGGRRRGIHSLGRSSSRRRGNP